VRIGFFTDTYLPIANGICYVIDILRKDLEEAGHEVYVFAPRDIRWHLPNEKRVIRYPALGGFFYKDQFNSFLWPPKQYSKIKQLKLDVIVGFTPSYIGGFGYYCAKRLDIPYLIHYGTDLENYGELYKSTTIGGMIGAPILAPYLLGMGFSEWLHYFFGMFRSSDNEAYFSSVCRHMMLPLHKRTAAVIATSDKIANKLKTWPIEQNISVIPTGVNNLPLDQNFKKYFADKYGLTLNDEIILYAGRLSVEKNLDLLIAAFAKIAVTRPKAKLLLVGDFQYRHNLEQQAKETGFSDRIIFSGQVDRADLGSVYALGDVFAFPSLTDCQALVLNEAAHAGLPLVWCDTDSLNPVLEDEVSGLKAEANKEDMAQKLDRILSDDRLAKRLSDGAKAKASAFTEKKQTDKIEELLKELIK
jgi:1,2-diacylglycerol 3-alpha-glucosyltransferase